MRKIFYRYFVQIILIALTLGGGYAFYQQQMKEKPPVQKNPPQERDYSIAVQKAVYQNINPIIELYGESVAKRVIEMRSFVGGQIIHIHPQLKAGMSIKKDELLVEIDDFEYRGAVIEAKAVLEDAKAQLKEVEAQIESEQNALEFAISQLYIAKRDLKRIENLRKTGSATDSIVDDRRFIVSQRTDNLTKKQNNFAVLNARIEQRKSQIDRAAWALEKAERNLKNTILRAPFDAIIASSSVEEGSLVNTNGAIATLYEKGEMEARFILPDRYFQKLSQSDEQLIGRPITLYWNGFEDDNRYEGEISHIGSEISSETGGIDVFATIFLSETQHLRPGAFVTLFVEDRLYENVISIPQSAIYNDAYVFIHKEGRLMRKEIVIEGVDRNNLLIKGDISEGDEIMITRLSNAGEGLKVRIIAAKDGEMTSKASANKAQ